MDPAIHEALKSVQEISKAEIAAVHLHSQHSFYSRFARSFITARGFQDSETALIRIEKGAKKVLFNAPLRDREALRTLTQRASDLLRIMPDDPEHVPLSTPAGAITTEALDAPTASLTESDHDAHIRPTVEKYGSALAGFFQHGVNVESFASTIGHSYQHAETFSLYSCTARHEGGSGKARRRSHRIRDIQIGDVSESAFKTAQENRSPRPLPAAAYPVVLSPGAMADLLAFFLQSMDRRKADEGRTYFSAGEGKTKIGTPIASEQVTLWSDPAAPELPSVPFTKDGEVIEKEIWVENGILKALPTSRFWAKKSGISPTPEPSNLLMRGHEDTTASLIRRVDRGLYIHHLWYMRTVDTREMLITGLTRDGVFWIENGEIKYPVNNFRFNESPGEILKRIVALTPTKVAWGAEVDEHKLAAPAALVNRFRFTSVSEAQ